MADDVDTGYLVHLNDVATQDVEEVRRKERTYKGSWKRRGGVGAFMMLARKWDRLESMCRDSDWDIFNVLDLSRGDMGESFGAKDEAPDGTALAEIRDLRRYLLLVESEYQHRRARQQMVERPTFYGKLAEPQEEAERVLRVVAPGMHTSAAFEMVPEQSREQRLEESFKHLQDEAGTPRPEGAWPAEPDTGVPPWEQHRRRYQNALELGAQIEPHCTNSGDRNDSAQLGAAYRLLQVDVLPHITHDSAHPVPWSRRASTALREAEDMLDALANKVRPNRPTLHPK